MKYVSLSLLFSIALAACATFLPPKMIDHQGNEVDIHDAKSCFSCHDDMKDHSHPVMIDYPPAGNGYASAADVAGSGLKLVDGKVTCITCHDLTNTETAHLAKTMNNSQLCLACHIK